MLLQYIVVGNSSTNVALSMVGEERSYQNSLYIKKNYEFPLIKGTTNMSI